MGLKIVKEVGTNKRERKGMLRADLLRDLFVFGQVLVDSTQELVKPIISPTVTVHRNINRDFAQYAIMWFAIKDIQWSQALLHTVDYTTYCQSPQTISVLSNDAIYPIDRSDSGVERRPWRGFWHVKLSASNQIHPKV